MLVVKTLFIFMKGTDSQPSQSTKKQRLGNLPTYLDIYILPSSWHTMQVLKARDVPGEAQTASRDFPTPLSEGMNKNTRSDTVDGRIPAPPAMYKTL